ncbi:MAG TPA: DUF1015 domain-containing protein [Acidimicrobiales bacterium]
MPRFLPFRGVHYDVTRADLALVTSPPYDVLDEVDRSRLAALHPANAVVIDLPIDGEDPYREAGETLRRWLADGTLVQDEQPSFYVYRMESTDESGNRRGTTGVFGALELSRPGEGGILPHEHTTPKAKSDRLNLLRGARANLSAVWGLSPSVGLSELLEVAEPAWADWTDTDGVRHTIWTISDAARVAAITEAVGTSPVVIADGHHRYETSLAYRDEQRAAGAGADAASEAALVYVVELVDDELNVLPIHRLIDGLPDDVDLPLALAEWFTVTPAGTIGPDIATRMDAEGSLVLVTAAGAWFLHPRPEALASARDLDSSRLDVALAGLAPHHLTFQHGVEQVTAKVASGQAQAGVLLRPASVAQIIDIAHGGERMPPKTTFFHPKPRTGVVFRLL